MFFTLICLGLRKSHTFEIKTLILLVIILFWVILLGNVLFETCYQISTNNSRLKWTIEFCLIWNKYRIFQVEFWIRYSHVSCLFSTYHVIKNKQLKIMAASLGRNDLIMRPSIWAGAIHACNNLGIFFIFWAIFNFDLKGINFDLKGISFQNWYF